MPTSSRAFDPARAAELGAFVEAAYAMHASDPASLTPTAVGIPATHELVARITMSDFLFGRETPQFYGIVARERANPALHVVAIRGSANALEIFDDLDVISTGFSRVPNGGRVAQGFLRIYGTLAVVPVGGVRAPGAVVPGGTFAKQVDAVARGGSAAATPRSPLARAALTASAAIPPLRALVARALAPPSIAVAGHSLGAALATMYVLDNAVNAKLRMPLVCTFGSPRVGNDGFTKAYDALGLASWRVVNVCDLVPNLPPDVFGFRHVATPELVDSSGRARDTPGCAHALRTYLALLDPRLAPSAACALGGGTPA